MAIYKLSTTSARLLARRSTLRGVGVMVLPALVGAALVMMLQNIKPSPLVIVMFLVVATILSASRYRRMNKAFAALQYEVSGDRITRTLPGFPSFSLRRDDVQRIELQPSGDILLRTMRVSETIAIPAGIEERSALLEELSLWKAPEEGRSLSPALRSYVTMIATLIAFALFFASTNRLLTLCVGIPLAVGLAISIIVIAVNRQLATRTRVLTLVAILPLLAIVGRIVAILKT